ncbi:MAG TPA: phosphatidylglycerol lysyltransferase domain-containing protein [Dehalococcoidia bacterium]|nr:phosphatidylglycerol lysyltransferase domain-containing protein [Dehalococcoidia bacterium]
MSLVRGRLERRLIAGAAVFLALYNGLLSMFRAPFSGFGQFEHQIAPDLLRGSHFLLLGSAITLLLISPGLWHGKRFAWLLALGCGLVSVLAHPLRNVDLWGTGGSILFIGLLLGARPQFPARSDPPTALRGIATLVAGLLAVFLYALAGLYFLDTEFRHSISLTLAFSDAIRLMFVVPSIESKPVTHYATAFIDSVRFAILLVWVAGAVQLLRPVVYKARTLPRERDHVRQLLEEHATSSLAFFALLPDKSYFFSEDGNAVLAYAVAGDTAVVLGDPLGCEAEFREVIASFREYCELNGWAYTFNQARPEHLPLYRSLGLKALKTGEEGIVQVQEFSLGGHAHKHLRSTMNRFEREGFTTEVLSPPCGPELIAKLKAISDDWIAQGQRRERGFMLGYFDEDLLQQCEIMVALDANGVAVAFANIIPSYKSYEGNFDMLRYGSEPKDVADFIYVSLIRHFREQGFTGMNLGLAPFSGLEHGDQRSPAAIAMRLLYRYGTFLLRYQGLREFKEKFASVWEPRYLIYRDETQLPGLAIATMRVAERDRAKGFLKGLKRREGSRALLVSGPSAS